MASTTTRVVLPVVLAFAGLYPSHASAQNRNLLKEDLCGLVHVYQIWWGAAQATKDDGTKMYVNLDRSETKHSWPLWREKWFAAVGNEQDDNKQFTLAEDAICITIFGPNYGNQSSDHQQWIRDHRSKTSPHLAWLQFLWGDLIPAGVLRAIQSTQTNKLDPPGLS